MTAIPICTICGFENRPWDDATWSRCHNCGADIPPVENLNLAERRLMDRMVAIARAKTVDVKGDVL